MLMKSKADSTEVPVITILGMGGLGKTTLAQDIYHDENVVKCFDLKAWVCVSDVFDVAKITRAIIKQIPGEDNKEMLELNELQEKLKEMLSGKKFLLVLDDIWNEDYLKWELLLGLFPSGAATAGSRILATTRNESVASNMSLTGPRYHLTKLGDDDCLSLLASHALGRDGFAEHLHLKESGEKIVKKCGHLPLAIKMVAGLLRRKPQLQSEWEAVINSREWTEERSNILGQETVVTMSPQLPTMTFLPMTSLRPSHVIGREKEKKEIVDMLLKPEADSAEVPVITIVGMGGMGKTTLAQDVYNDKKVQGCFDLGAWVCVSDVFDVAVITREILKQILPADNMETLELTHLQVKLKETLSGKKFLVVLDDIWNEDCHKWENLLLSFPSGAAAVGSKILATTRNKSVALIMSPTGPLYHLRQLGEDDSLSLLALIALERNDFEENTYDFKENTYWKDLKDLKDLKEIGKQIVKKCHHLPLAIKMVASLLRNMERGKQTWEAVVNNNNWIEESGDILSALRVSYYNLPSHLKRCFAYCSIIPKNYIFDKNDLVLFWMAEGFLQPAKLSMLRMEDFGRDCFQELLSRSFFQLTSGSESEFIMHDLINNLAVEVAGERSFQMDGAWDENQNYKISDRTRHVSFICQDYEVSEKFNISATARRLRTFLALPHRRFNSPSYQDVFGISNTILPLMLSQLLYLRVLNLRGYRIDELPDAIGELKHLRYLKLTGAYISQLPEVVCSLYNLQTLSLNGCRSLWKLPSSIDCLTNLRHLGLEVTPSLKKLPSGIGKLTCLQTLSKIIVGRDTGTSNLKDLKDLRHLHGTLSIEELRNVTNDQDAVDADLRSKEHLEVLKLQWQYSWESADSSRDRLLENRVLENLQPHRNLKVLEIEGYGGTEFPSWVGELSHLRDLKIKYCSSLVWDANDRLPKSLINLVLWDCPESVLSNWGFHGLTSLQTLSIAGFENDVLVEQGDSTGGGASTSTSTSYLFPPSLTKLSILEFPKLASLSNSLQNLTSLRELYISDCPNLEPLPNLLQNVTSLKLFINNFPKWNP